MIYFKNKEFVCRCGCVMPSEVQANIEALVSNVLDPLREAYGKPIYVSSGYRCEKHNAAVGGVPRSQHLLGEAADISVKSENVKGKSELAELARLIVAQGRFDQLILYPSFLHVSYKHPSTGSGANRHKILRKTTSGYAVVPHREILQMSYR